LLLVPGSACAPSAPPSLPPSTPQASETEQCHLLLFPESNAESLLGRTVQVAREGGLTISDARAPGCEVVVKREAAAFHSQRRVEAHTMTSLAAGYAKFVSIEASFGQKHLATVDVDNAEILRADVRGSCGDYVIDTVFVGRGRRS